MINIFSISFCDNNNIYKLFSLLGHLFNIIKILVPIIIIIYGSIDLLKGVINPNNKNDIKLFVKRLIYGISFFFITAIVMFIFSLLNNNLDNKCLEVFLNPNNVNLNSIDIDEIQDRTQCENLGDPYIWIDDQCRIDISNDRVGE